MAELSVRDLLIKVGFNVEDSGLKHAEKGVSSLISSATKLGAVIGALGASFFALADSVAREADELGNTSDKLGITTRQLQKMKDAAYLADVEYDSLKVGLRIFQRTLGYAQQGQKAYVQYLQYAGIKTLKDAHGQWKSQSVILGEVANSIRNAKTQSTRMAIAMEVLGRSGGDLIPFFKQGAAGIKKLMETTQDYGYILTKTNIEAGELFDAQRKKMLIFYRGVKDYLGIQLVPIFNKYIGSILEMIKSHKKLILIGVANFFKTLRLAMLPLALTAMAVFKIFDKIANAIGGWGRLIKWLGVVLAVAFGYKTTKMIIALSAALLSRLAPALLGLEVAIAPLQLLISVVAGLGMVLYLIYDDFEHYEKGSKSFIGHIMSTYPKTAKTLIFFGKAIEFVANQLDKIHTTMSSGSVSNISRFIHSGLLGKKMQGMFPIDLSRQIALSEKSISGAGNISNAGGSNRGITVSSNPTVNITVPVGTDSFQKKWFESVVTKQLHKTLQQSYSEALVGNAATLR